MQDFDDGELLRQYVEGKSEEAFATLAARHVNKVYSVAWRHTGNADHAQEITQAVFVMLARKARDLRRGVILSGWLHHAARLAAVTFVRGEIRRARREEAHMQTMVNEPDSGAWTQIAPWLDAAIEQLNPKDRAAVVLRYFDGKSMKEIGAALGASEAAAQKRVDRSVERLRLFFAKRGVASTSAVITAAISAHAVQPAPAALVQIISGAAIPGAVVGGSTLVLVQGVLKLMAWNTKMVVVGVALFGVTAFSVTRYQQKLRQENDALQKQIALLQNDKQSLSDRLNHSSRTHYLPPPAAPIAASPSQEAPELRGTNLILETMLGDVNPVNLTSAQVAAYLAANGRTAETLTAAFYASGDPALLKEAMEKFPNNPQVDLAAIFRAGATPEEQRQWINTFEQSAPNNALANYLSAQNYFKAGQDAQAVQELTAAAGKPQFQDYSMNALQGLQEAFRAGGYSEAEADVIGGAEVQFPQDNSMRALAQNMVSLANSYQQAGDTASAQNVLQMVMNLGQSVGDSAPSFVIDQLIEASIQRTALAAMDPNSPYGDSGQTAQDQINQLAQQTAALKDINRQFQAVVPQMTDQDWISFRERQAIFGENAAAQWAISKHAQP